MDGFRDFLESSSIHGLSYISTYQNAGVKLCWALVVVSGFVTAGILIQNSVKAWNESPVSTTLETLPLSKVQFPIINICPPIHTTTSMNHDLVTANNTYLNKTIIDELRHLSAVWLQEEEFYEALEDKNSFMESNNSFNNWYLGYNKVTLPYKLYDKHNYKMFITDTAGTISTPWFGKRFSADRFLKGINYVFEISLPSNISTFTSNASLAVDITLDTKETVGGGDYMTISSPGKYKTERFRHTGKKIVTKRYLVGNNLTVQNNKFIIRFYRKISQTDVDQ